MCVLRLESLCRQTATDIDLRYPVQGAERQRERQRQRQTDIDRDRQRQRKRVFVCPKTGEPCVGRQRLILTSGILCKVQRDRERDRDRDRPDIDRDRQRQRKRVFVCPKTGEPCVGRQRLILTSGILCKVQRDRERDRDRDRQT